MRGTEKIALYKRDMAGLLSNLFSKENAEIRLLIVFLISLLLVYFKATFIALVFITGVILFYLLQRNQHMEYFQEKFTPSTTRADVAKPRRVETCAPTACNQPRFCNDEVLQNFNDPCYVSNNQRLQGGPNPKTLVPPVVVPPSHDMDFWRMNNLATHSAINSEMQQDMYLSGFVPVGCCESDPCAPIPSCGPNSSFPIYKLPPCPRPVQRESSGDSSSDSSSDEDDEAEEKLKPCFDGPFCNIPPQLADDCNLFTNIIQPGVYSRSEVIEPINSNIGISATPQLPPTSVSRAGACATFDSCGNEITAYTEHDPRVVEGVYSRRGGRGVAQNEANVYDPRHTGYGTAYRGYTDVNLGQPRFMYDDVNAVRMPNYLVRSNIDNLPFADQYGPMASRNELGSKMRSLANDAYCRNSTEFRSDLQQRLMRKANARAWQQRAAPISTSSQYMGGGMSCK
jgi:hypothetical protein